MQQLRDAVIAFQRQREGGEEPDVAKEIAAWLALAKYYDENPNDPEVRHTDLLADECFRAAANLGDHRSQYHFGRRIFDRARFWDDLAQSPFGCEAQRRYAEAYYREAFGYLQEADMHGVYLAKRLLGLAHYRGWGLPEDTEKGLDLIIGSIDEQGAWDKAKDIVTTIGLDPQDFFSKLAQRKGDR